MFEKLLLLVFVALASATPASFRYYLDSACTQPENDVVHGPCWPDPTSGDKGYTGYTWKFSCDANNQVLEHECGPAGNTECTGCDDGWWWGDYGDTCVEYKRGGVTLWYKYTCLN